MAAKSTVGRRSAGRHRTAQARDARRESSPKTRRSSRRNQPETVRQGRSPGVDLRVRARAAIIVRAVMQTMASRVAAAREEIKAVTRVRGEVQDRAVTKVREEIKAVTRVRGETRAVTRVRGEARAATRAREETRVREGIRGQEEARAREEIRVPIPRDQDKTVLPGSLIKAKEERQGRARSAETGICSRWKPSPRT